MKHILEDYLDAEEKFFDYKTSSVTGKIVFDTTKTGMSYYDELLTNPEYMRKRKNLVGEIVYMTPTEYFKGCAEIFNSTVERQISQTRADKSTFDHLMTVLTRHKKMFPIGFLNYAQNGQEGRHRMLAAAEYAGWETKQPVLVINWADEARHKREVEQELKREDDIKVRGACLDALNYHFYNIAELQNEIQCKLNQKFCVSIGDDISFDFTSDDVNKEYIVKCGKGEYSFGYDSVKWEEGEPDPDLDLDDLDIELDELEDDDISDWLKKYLGECFTRNNINEAIEKHETLNPLIWNGKEIKANVKSAIEEIVSKYIEDSMILSEDDIIDVELLGSNASYNYTEHSDLDIHLVVNMESISSDPALVQIACNAEKALFNNAFDFKIKGLDVELYVEDVKTGAASNGVYSITKDKWLKVPIHKNIPDVSNDSQYLNLLDIWTSKAKVIMSSTSSRDIQNFVNELYNLRRLSIMTDGEYARGNLVFKEIRNSGLLKELKDKINELTSKELSLESLKRS